MVLMAAALAWPIGAARSAAQNTDEYRIKAALIFNLAKFVEWPGDAFKTDNAPITFCVLGEDPFGSSLEETLKGHAVKGHPAILKRIADVTAACQVLFIAESETKRLPSILHRVRDLRTVTIGEAEGFLDEGGMINLVNRDQQVKFAVNLSAADRAHVKISARVLALALSARGYSDRKPNQH